MSKAPAIVTWLCVSITFSVLVFLLGFILVKGLPYVKPSLFALKYNSDNVSLVPALFNTVYMVLIALLISVPPGVFSAIYLAEYAPRGNRFVKLIRVTAETLSGIPSIIYGLFGTLFFVIWLGWGYSLLAGGFTLAIMILPLIMRTTEESIKAIPDMYREGSFGLGAGKLRTVFRVILPACAPGILAGIILSVGRIVGETAALIYTAGTFAQTVVNPMGSGRTLAIHMYALSGEGLYIGQAYATAVVLLVVVVGINALSSLVAKRISRNIPQ
ncbi:MAG: phosphate ABC transporter permease PstA [Oscillospiraceae bacterium]|nr:phosphate ABC transporter permease PstA [Oscillospiraceae bacterium]